MYTIVKARVLDQTLLIVDHPPLAAGGKNHILVEVEFDDSWAGYGKLAVFHRTEEPGRVYRAQMVNDAALVPWEVCLKSGYVQFSVEGAAGTVTRTTSSVPLRLQKGVPAGLTPQEPLPDVYQQLLSAFGGVEQSIAVERARLDAQLAASTVDNELADIRVGADGRTYSSAGTAVRSQIGYSLLWRTAPAFDANQCTGIGFYFAGGSENWANIPGVAGMLASFYGNTEHRLYQMFFEYGSAGHVYTRHHLGSVGFTEWVRFATENEVREAAAVYTLERKSPTLVYIYQRGAKGIVRYHVERTTNSDINQDVWRLSSIYLCDAAKAGIKAVSTFGADLEGVVLLKNGADHIGGVHGDETATGYALFIDGKEYTFDEELPTTANEIRLVVKSTLTHVNTANACMERIKQLTFDMAGVHIRNEWEALEALSIQSIRSCMFSVQKDCITHYYDSNVSLYPVAVPATTEEGAILSENSNMVDVQYIGDISVHHWAGARGGDASQYSTLLQDYGPRLKSYFNCFDGHEAVAGEKMVAENHFRIAY